MTSREREVFFLIRENPMIAQEEIAKKLGISRSAVSVHISSLLRQGALRGRGYVINEENYHVVIGTAGIDFRGMIEGEQSDSVSENIVNYYGRISSLFGGAAFNISDCLRNIGENTRMVAPIGSDMFGKQLAEYCVEQQINVDDCLYLPDTPQSIMLQLRDEKNNWTTSMVNYFSESRMTPQFFSEKCKMLKNASTIVMTDIITPESAAFLLSEHAAAESWLVFSGVTSRIDRLIHLAPQARHVYMNLRAAARVTGAQLDEGYAKIGEKLRRTGVQEVFVSCDDRLILHITEQGCTGYPTLPHTRSDGERGKDAFVAGLLATAGSNRPMAERIRFASQVSILACASEPGKASLNREAVELAMMAK